MRPKPPRHLGYDFEDDPKPRPRCTIRGCRKVISLREAQVMVCDEHAIRIWEHVQRYRNDPTFLEAAVAAYERKIQNEAWADREKRRRNNPSPADRAETARALFGELGDRPMVEEDQEIFEDIYYLRQGGLIKIGYSTRIDERLYAYGPTAEVLAHHPGTRADERDLHRSFRPFLAHGREWYHPAQILMDHIAQVVETHGPPVCIPEWSTPKDTPHAMRRSSQAKPTGLSI